MFLPPQPNTDEFDFCRQSGMQNTFAICSIFNFIVSSFMREISSDSLINFDRPSLRRVSSKRYCIKRQHVALHRCSMTGAIPVTTVTASLVCIRQESDRRRRSPCKECSCHEATACFHSHTQKGIFARLPRDNEYHYHHDRPWNNPIRTVLGSLPHGGPRQPTSGSSLASLPLPFSHSAVSLWRTLPRSKGSEPLRRETLGRY